MDICPMAKIGTDIQYASGILKSGGLVAIPTETVYGLASNALDESAVLQIYAAKNRPFFDPLIVHISDVDQLEKYAQNIPSVAQQLAKAFWPGPLTILLNRKNIIPHLITSGLPDVALRVPNHTLTLELLRSLDFPLAAPSANPFGYVSPTTAQHVQNQLGDKIDYIIDGGPCMVGIESTIVGFENEKVIVYRLGGLAIEKIEKLVDEVEIRINQSSNPKAPGMLKSHYAPKKPLYFGNVAAKIKEHQGKKIGLISFNKKYSGEKITNILLSENGIAEEAAKNLFSALRKFDESDVEIIIAEELPDHFIGRAINDRLRRAQG